MKTILVPTDFSENAAHAAETAAMLAEKLHASLLLFHDYPKIPVAPYYMGGPWLADTLTDGEEEDREKFEALEERLEDMFANVDSTEYKPNVETRFEEGNIGENIHKLAEQKHIEMIVIGSRSDCEIEHFLKGSDTGNIIAHAPAPVLIVPIKANLYQLDKIAFATNFYPEDVKAIKYLISLRRFFDFEIEVIHVTVNGENTVNDAQKNNFTQQLTALENTQITYKEIRGKEVINRLNRICKQTQADLLAMTHRQHSFFSHMFEKETMQKMLVNQKVPLLIFPAEFNK